MDGWHGGWLATGLMWILPLLLLLVAIAPVVRSPGWSRGEITKEQFEDVKRTPGR